MAVHMAMDWHEGEKQMHKLMHVPEQDNPTNSMLSPNAARSLIQYPLIAVGTLDTNGRPWTTVWGGSPGLGQPLGNNIIGIKTAVERRFDPVIDILFGRNADGVVVKESGEGRMIGALTIDFETRRRQKLFGRMIAGAVAAVSNEISEDEASNEQKENAETTHQVQVVCRIDQSLGNCPKYLNKKIIRPATPSPTLVSSSTDLVSEAVEMIKRSDLFFLSSSHNDLDMDTNHRGGPAGFVRLHRTSSGQWELFWPEYSGNRLYQTLGNLTETPRCGLCFPDFDTGDVLYLTGDTSILVGAGAAKLLPRSNLAVKITVVEARFVQQGLTFRGTPGEPSPYNPKVRPLAEEASTIDLRDTSSNTNTATLMGKQQLTPTIYRYTFSLANPGTWSAGQWVALDLSAEMDIGYSHMRDDDPTSINDDFIRTFTISSPPAPNADRSDDHFEITVRNVGPVTRFLSKQQPNGSFEVAVRGFGGGMKIEQEDDLVTPFIAGGVGITPLLAQLPDLDVGKLRVFWTLQVDDVDLAVDVVSKHPEATKCFRLYFTGFGGAEDSQGSAKFDQLRRAGVSSIDTRRLLKNDLQDSGLSDGWHVCVSTRLRKTLEEWLHDQVLLFEDFNF